MTEDSIYRWLFFALLGGLALVRLYYAVQVKRAGQRYWNTDREAVEREGLLSLALRLGLFVVLVALVVLYATDPPWMQRLVLPLPRGLRWGGFVLGVGGLGLLVWVHETLGAHWSTDLQLRETHALVQSGPYRRIRHPMYTAIFAVGIGMALVSAHALMVALATAEIAVLSLRIGREEAMMLDAFGEQYARYRARTGRFVPRIMPAALRR